MRSSLILLSLLAFAGSVLAAEPAGNNAKCVKTIVKENAPTAQAVFPANFDAKKWANGDFAKIGKSPAKGWKLKNGEIPAFWWIPASNRGARELEVVPYADGKGNFLRLKGGSIGKDLNFTGKKLTITYRMRGKGSCYFYILRYNKKGSNLPSCLTRFLHKVDYKTWTDGTIQKELPWEEGERRIFRLDVFNDGHLDFDYIYLTIQ